MSDKNNVEIRITGKNLSEDAFKKVSAALKDIDGQTTEITTKGRSSWRSLFSTVAGGVTAGNLLSDAFKSAGAMLARIPGQLVELGQRGSEVNDIRASFERLTQSVGETSGAVLDQLRQAFGGAVSDFDLMRSANDALQRGLTMSAAEMATVASGARVLGETVGGDVHDKFKRLLDAIGRGQERELKSLGLNLVNIEAAMDAYATSIGTTVGKLDEQGKQQALQNAVLSESRRLIAENGAVTNDFGDNIAAVTARLTNWRDGLAAAIEKSSTLNSVAARLLDTMDGLPPSLQAAAGGLTLVGGGVLQILGQLTPLIPMLAVSLPGALRTSTAATTGFAGAVRGLSATLLGPAGLIAALGGAAVAFTIFRTSQIRSEAEQMLEAGRLIGRAARDINEARDVLDAYQKGLAGQSLPLKGTALTMAMATAWQKGAEAAGALTDTMGEGVIRIAAFADRAAAAAASSSTYTGKLREMRAEVAALTAAQLREFEAAKLVGGSQEALLKTWGLTAAHVALVEARLRAQADAAKTAAAATKKFQEVLKDMVADGDEHARQISRGIREADAAAQQRDLDAMNTRWLNAQQLLAEAERGFLETRRERTMNAHTIQLLLIGEERDKKIAALEQWGHTTEEGVAIVQREYEEKMAAARQAHNDELKRMQAALNTWGTMAKGWAKTFPELLVQGLTGGGGISGALKAIGATAGKDIFSNLFTGADGEGGMAKLVGGKLGEILKGAAGPLGSLVGSLGGQLLGKVFGFRSADQQREKKENAEATQQVKDLRTELLATYGSMDNLRMLGKLTGTDITAAFGHQGKKGLEQFKKDIEKFEKEVGAFQAKFNQNLSGILSQAEGIGFKLPPTLDPYIAKFKELGLITDENQQLLAGFGDHAVIDHRKMEEAASLLGVRFESLGGAFQRAKIGETAAQYLEALDLLKRGGADMGAVIGDAADKVSEFVQQSMRSGVPLAENWREYVEELIRTGQLLDENGEKITDINTLSFGDPIKIGLERIGDLLERLLTGLGIDLPNAIANIPNSIDIDVNYHTHQTGPGAPSRDGGIWEGGTVDMPGADAGGLYTRPTVRVFAERQPEVAGSPNAIVDALTRAMKDAGWGSAGGGDGQIVIEHVTLVTRDNRVLAEAVVPEIPYVVKHRVGPGRRR